jgi:hypothetical protein
MFALTEFHHPPSNNLIIMKSIYTLLLTALCCVTSQRIFAQGAPGFQGNTLFGNQSSGAFYILGSTSTSSGPYIEMFSNASGAPGTVGYVAGYNSYKTNSQSHIFWTPTGPSSYSPALIIQQDGKVNIGIHLPTTHPDYKLAVEGKLVAQSFYVTNISTWADFVFEPSYQPMALPTLESYLLKNKHLPYVPSAKEVEANGYNVAEMDAKLLQTVEELTLQVINLHKELQQSNARIIELERGMKDGMKEK